MLKKPYRTENIKVTDGEEVKEFDKWDTVCGVESHFDAKDADLKTRRVERVYTPSKFAKTNLPTYVNGVWIKPAKEQTYDMEEMLKVLPVCEILPKTFYKQAGVRTITSSAREIIEDCWFEIGSSIYSYGAEQNKKDVKEFIYFAVNVNGSKMAYAYKFTKENEAMLKNPETIQTIENIVIALKLVSDKLKFLSASKKEEDKPLIEAAKREQKKYISLLSNGFESEGKVNDNMKEEGLLKTVEDEKARYKKEFVAKVEKAYHESKLKEIENQQDSKGKKSSKSRFLDKVVDVAYSIAWPTEAKKLKQQRKEEKAKAQQEDGLGLNK